MDKEISFLLDEITEKGIKEVEDILFSIKHPLVGKHIKFLNAFTKELVKAYAHQQHNEIKPIVQYRETTLQNYKPSQYREQQKVLVQQPTIPLSQQPTEQLPQELYPKQISPLPQQEQPQQVTMQVTKLPLILDRETNEELASASIENDLYTVHQPSLDDHERQVLMSLKEHIKKKEWILGEKKKLNKLIMKCAKKQGISYDETQFIKYKYHLIRDLLNLGLIEPLLHDKKITKIICEGPAKYLVIYREGRKLRTNLMFPGKDELTAFLYNLAQKTFQKLSSENPILDALYHNFRVQATLGNDTLPSKFILSKVES